MHAFIGRLAHAEPGSDVNHAAQSSDTEPVSTFFASDEHGGLRIAAVCAVVAIAAALDSILTDFALAPASV